MVEDSGLGPFFKRFDDTLNVKLSNNGEPVNEVNDLLATFSPHGKYDIFEEYIKLIAVQTRKKHYRIMGHILPGYKITDVTW